MQVFEDHQQCMVQRVAQDDALDRVERALALDRRVHLGQRIGTIRNTEQGE